MSVQGIPPGPDFIHALSGTRARAIVRMRMWLYTAVIALFIGAAAFVPNVPERRAVLTALTATLFVPYLAWRFVRERHAQTVWEIGLVLVASILGVFVPELWGPGLLASVLIVTWISTTATRWLSTCVCVSTLVPFGLAGPTSEFGAWQPIYATAVLVSLGYSQLGSIHQRQFRRLERQLATALDHGRVAIHEFELGQPTVSSLVGPIQQMTGWTPDQWIATDHRTLIHPDDLAGFWIDSEAAHDGQLFDRIARFRRTDGTYAWLRDVSQVSTGRHGGRRLTGLTIDVSDAAEALQTAQHAAAFDRLTGLPNRETFRADLTARFARPGDFAVLLLDIDRFKMINDTLGHAAGDEVLIEVARRLQTAASPHHRVARLGGDEFALIVEEDVLRGNVLSWAELLASRLGVAVQLKDLAVSAPVSIGVVRRQKHNVDELTMLRWADMAMYEAKRLSRPAVEFDDELEQSSVQDLVMTADLRRALASGEILPYFQPQVDLASGRIVGAEALARWRHPQLGLLTADRFVRLLRLSDQFEVFTESILQQSIAALARWRSAGHDMSISVNISARSTHDATLAHRVVAACRRHGVPINLLTIEITEDEFLESSNTAAATLEELRRLGVRISIDDFGTGYSSFARLTDYTCDEIKLDHRIVLASPSSERARIVVRSVVEMARSLRCRLVAEGVETTEHSDFLRRLGCEVAQGYLFAPALSLDDFMNRLADQSPDVRQRYRSAG